MYNSPLSKLVKTHHGDDDETKYQSRVSQNVVQATPYETQDDDEYVNPYLSKTYGINTSTEDTSVEEDENDVSAFYDTSTSFSEGKSSSFSKARNKAKSRYKFDFTSYARNVMEAKNEYEKALYQQQENNPNDKYKTYTDKINNYSNKLNKLGQEVEKPDEEKVKYGVLGFIGDVANAITSPISAIWKGVEDFGKYDDKMNEYTNELKNNSDFKKWAKEQEQSGNTTYTYDDFYKTGNSKSFNKIYDEWKENTKGTDLAKTITQDALRSIWNNVSAPFKKTYYNITDDKDSYDETERKQYSTVDFLNEKRKNGSKIEKEAMKKLDSIGGEKYGTFLTDLVLGTAMEGGAGLDEAGKSLKYMKNVRNGKIDKINDAINMDKALKTVEKSHMPEIEQRAMKSTVETMSQIEKEEKIAKEIEKAKRIKKAKTLEELQKIETQQELIAENAHRLERQQRLQEANVKSLLNNKELQKQFAEEAKYLANDSRDKLGDLNFDGLKYMGKTIISKEKLGELAKKNSAYYALTAGITLADPFAGIYALGKGKTTEALSRLAEDNYKDNALGRASKTKDKALRTLYENFTGGKNAQYLKEGYEDFYKMLDANQASRIIKERGYDISKQSVDRLSKYEELRNNLTDEQANKVRQTIETPTEEVFDIETNMEKVINPDYVRQLGEASRKYISDMWNATKATKEYNGKLYSSKNKYVLQRKLANKVEDLYELNNSINKSSINYDEQVKKLLKSDLNVDRSILEDKRLSQISFTLQKSTEELAGYISHNYDMDYEQAYQIAKKYKIASTGTYRALEDVYGDISNMKITSKDIDMTKWTGKEEKVLEMSNKQVDEMVDKEAKKAELRQKEIDLSRESVIKKIKEGDYSHIDTKGMTEDQIKDLDKQYKIYAKSISNKEKRVKQLDESIEYYNNFKQQLLYDKSISRAEKNRKIKAIDEKLAPIKKEREEVNKKINKQINGRKQEIINSLTSKGFEEEQEALKRKEVVNKGNEIFNAKKTTVYDDEFEEFNKYIEDKKNFEEELKANQVKYKDRTKAVDEFTEKYINEHDLSDTTLDKIADYTNSSDTHYFDEIKAKNRSKRVENSLDTKYYYKRDEQGKLIKQPFNDKQSKSKQEFVEQLSKKYDGMITKEGKLNTITKYTNEAGEELTPINNMEDLGNGKYIYNSTKKEMVMSKSGNLAYREPSGELVELKEYNKINKKQLALKKQLDTVKSKLDKANKIDNIDEIRNWNKKYNELKEQIKELNNDKRKYLKDNPHIQSSVDDNNHIISGGNKLAYFDGDIVTKSEHGLNKKQLDEIEGYTRARSNYVRNIEAMNNKETGTFGKLTTMIKEDGREKSWKDIDVVKGIDDFANKYGNQRIDLDENTSVKYFEKFKRNANLRFNRCAKLVDESNLTKQQKASLKKYLKDKMSSLEAISRDSNMVHSKFGNSDDINKFGKAVYTIEERINKAIENYSEYSTLIGKEYKNNPLKRVISLNDGKQKINLDMQLTQNQAKKVMKEWKDTDDMFDGIAKEITYTKNMGASGIKRGNNVFIDASGKQSKGVLSHELAHIMDNKQNAKDTKNFVYKFSERVNSLDEKQTKKLVSLINKHILNGASDDINTNVTNYIEALKKDGATGYTVGRENFAEMCSMVLHPNKEVRDKFEEILGSDIKEDIYNILIHSNHKNVEEVIVPKYKLADVDYQNKIEDMQTILKNLNELNTVEEAVSKTDEIKKILEIPDKGDLTDLCKYKELERFLGEKANFKVKNGTSEFKYQDFDRQVKKVINNVDKLDENEKEFYDYVTNTLKDIGIEEDVIEPYKIAMHEYFTYLPHIVTQDVKNTNFDVAVGDIMGRTSDFRSGATNAYSISRRLQGTIDQINNIFKDSDEALGSGLTKLMVDNIDELVMKRLINDNDIFYDKATRETLIRTLGVKSLSMDEIVDMCKKVDVDEEGKKEIFYDFYEAEKMLSDLGISPTRKFYDDLVEKKAERARKVNPNLKVVIDDSDKEDNYVIMKAIKNAYDDHLVKKLKTGKYQMIVLNPKEEKVAGKFIGLDEFENAVNKKSERITESAMNLEDLNVNKRDMLRAIDEVNNVGYTPYSIIDHKSMSDEEIIKTMNDGAYLMPTSSIKHFEEYAKQTYTKDKNAFLKMLDTVTNTFKASALLTPKFHLNNAVGNALQNYASIGLAVLNPKKIKRSIEVFNGKNLNKKIGNGMTYKEVLESFKRMGGEDGTRMMEFKDKFNILRGTKKAKTETQKLLSKVNPLDNDFFMYTASNSVGGQIEGQARMINYIERLEQGCTPREAMDYVNKALFDYSDLTTFENNVMRRIMPFYTYTRKNFGANLDKLANNTKEMRLLNLALRSDYNNTTEEQRKFKPEYLGLGLGNNNYSSLDTPLEGFVGSLDSGQLISSVNPVIKSPIEAILNRSFYNDSNISEDNKFSEKANYVAESMIPIYKQFTSVKDASEGDNLAKSRLERQWLGKVVQTYNVENYKKQSMSKYAKKLEKQYYDYLDEHPEAKEELNTSQTNNYELERLKKKYINALNRSNKY